MENPHPDWFLAKEKREVHGSYWCKASDISVNPNFTSGQEPARYLCYGAFQGFIQIKYWPVASLPWIQRMWLRFSGIMINETLPSVTVSIEERSLDSILWLSMHSSQKRCEWNEPVYVKRRVWNRYAEYPYNIFHMWRIPWHFLCLLIMSLLVVRCSGKTIEKYFSFAHSHCVPVKNQRKANLRELVLQGNGKTVVIISKYVEPFFE